MPLVIYKIHDAKGKDMNLLLDWREMPSEGGRQRAQSAQPLDAALLAGSQVRHCYCGHFVWKIIIFNTNT